MNEEQGDRLIDVLTDIKVSITDTNYFKSKLYEEVKKSQLIIRKLSNSYFTEGLTIAQQKYVDDVLNHRTTIRLTKRLE